VYLYFEHHRDAHGKTVLTELRISSYGNGQLAISWKNPAENTKFDICKTVLKSVPIAYRSYDDTSKVWSYLESYGEQVIEKLKEVTKPLGEITCILVEDLASQCLSGKIDLTGKRKPVNVQDFFYQQAAPAATPTLTKEQVTDKLRLILGTDTVDKSSYRRAALRLHPDRNNGDGKPMSELNMLWQVYNA